MKLTPIRTLGGGGFGLVDLVRAEDGQTYARKTFNVAQTMPSDLVLNVKKRFAREAKTQSGIRHKNIVPVLHSELSADPPFYLMPAAICSLQDDLDKDKTLGGGWLRAIADIVAGLDELHQMEIYHRDLKPQNVLKYQNTDGSFYYAVSDFGLIAMNESRLSVLTFTGMAKGTDYYTAPEITSDLRKASAQSDIYSLGCIIHEMVGQGPRVPCHEIKEAGDYGAILRTCTRAEVNRRFRSVRSVLDALVSVTTDVPTIVTQKGAEFGNQLASGDPLDEASWRALIDFVEDNADDDDISAVLNQLRLDQIMDLCQRFTTMADELGQRFSNWVRSRSFQFERCDSLANILELFVQHGNLETKAEALMALLDLGTSHNRWYVERKFTELSDKAMDSALARRLSVEFRAAGREVCRMIEHLELSIRFDRSSFHPSLVQTLNEICS